MERRIIVDMIEASLFPRENRETPWNYINCKFIFVKSVEDKKIILTELINKGFEVYRFWKCHFDSKFDLENDEHFKDGIFTIKLYDCSSNE